VGLGTGMFLHELIPSNDVLGTIIFITMLSLAVYFQRFISKGIVEITINKDSLSLNWAKQFLFHKKTDREIPFGELKSYKYQKDKAFDLFKLILKDETEIVLWHFNFLKNDDFDKLVSDFPSIVSKFNKQISEKELSGIQAGKTHKIERTKTIYESSIAPFLAGLAIVMIIAITIIICNNSSGKSGTTIPGLAAMSGAIFFLAQYFSYRRKKEND
jgi:hypothetical protein